jgi:hypothetical protein
MGKGSVRLTSIDRPRSVPAAALAASGYVAGSVEIRWLATIDRVRSNQNVEICVRTLPLSGIPDPST